MGHRVRRLNEPPQRQALVERNLDRLFTEVPYYRQRKPEILNFEEWPFMTRAERSSVPYQLLVPDSYDAAGELTKGSATLLSTSGSTAEPLRALVDGQASVPLDYWALWGFRSEPRMGCLTSPACAGAQCGARSADRGTRQRGPRLLSFQATPALFTEPSSFFEDIAAEWADYRPEVVLANPVYLHWVLRRTHELGLRLTPPRLVLTSYQYSSVCQRRVLEAFAPTAGLYGATEFGGTDVAIGCPSGHLHVLGAQVHVELLSGGWPGDVGELAVSTPLSRTTPLLRYQPGDLAALRPAVGGECALDALDVLELHGRTEDCLDAPKGVFTTKAVDDALSRFEWLEFYSIREAASVGAHLDFVAQAGPASAANELRDVLEALLGERMTVTQRPMLTLAKSHKLRLTGPVDGESEEAPLRWG